MFKAKAFITGKGKLLSPLYFLIEKKSDEVRKQIGTVEVPQKAFLAVLKLD
jgi:translation elongation factor EF-4